MNFQIALSIVLLALFYMVPGYITAKLGKTNAEHLPTLSGVLIYIGSPFLVISSFLSLEPSRENTLGMVYFFLATLILQTVFFLLVFFFSNAKKNAVRRIIAMGATCGNVGFFGIPVVRALFPHSPEVACYAICYTISMNILVFTLGIYCLTGEKKYISLRAALCNPTMLGLLIALPLYFSNAARLLPDFLTTGAHTMASMTTPLCMFILGIRLASSPIKAIFCDKRIYITSLLKLVLFPLFCLACAKLLPFDKAFEGALVILSATPCAAVILSLAEIHHSEEKASAACILASVLLCLFTIPLLALAI
ncbi:MAG: hypothetical protein E7616_07940 [Ruminococcaceae bacterium]|nr:hypothetical protein [Oscillospiraceae bacterium]